MKRNLLLLLLKVGCIDGRCGDDEEESKVAMKQSLNFIIDGSL
jgi:hypothetical protein